MCLLQSSLNGVQTKKNKNKSVRLFKVALQRYCTCGRAWGRAWCVDFDGFKCRIQFQDELVELFQGRVKFGLIGTLINCVLCWIQVDGLTHSENVTGYHVGHAFSCRHHVRRARSASGAAKEWDTMGGRSVFTGMGSPFCALQNRHNNRWFSQMLIWYLSSIWIPITVQYLPCFVPNRCCWRLLPLADMSRVDTQPDTSWVSKSLGFEPGTFSWALTAKPVCLDAYVHIYYLHSILLPHSHSQTRDLKVLTSCNLWLFQLQYVIV